MWTIRFRNGNMKRFKFPIRTTAEGSADPQAGCPAADSGDLAAYDKLFDNDTHSCDMGQFVTKS
jgi:adenylylsulfate reductase subunit B